MIGSRRYSRPRSERGRYRQALVAALSGLVAPVSLFLGARNTISRRLRRDGWELPEVPS